jgi:hypothetical protein
VSSATSREGDTAGPARPAPARSAAARRVFGAGAGVLGGEGLAAYFYLALGEALAAADVIIPLAIALVLVAAILRQRSGLRSCLPLALLGCQPARTASTGANQLGPARMGSGTRSLSDRARYPI